MRGKSVEVLAIPSLWPAGAPAHRITSKYHGKGAGQQAFTDLARWS
jgi:hypothetical protein